MCINIGMCSMFWDAYGCVYVVDICRSVGECVFAYMCVIILFYLFVCMCACVCVYWS